METIELKEFFKADNLLRQTPTPDQYDRLISGDCKLTFKGYTLGLYINLPRKQLSEMRDIARTTKFVATARARRGLPTQSSVFGALPRTPIRVDFCRFTKQSEAESQHFETSFKFSELLAGIYKEHLPEAYEYNRRIVAESVEKDWRTNDTPFTTCNFNVNHAIKYHRDAGNFRGVYSNVLIIREGITGGELVFPELRLAFAQTDGALGIFDGQRWIHGVTPLQKTGATPYRASVVFYALDGMRHCYPYEAELNRFKTKRTEREVSRATGNSKLRAMVPRAGHARPV